MKFSYLILAVLLLTGYQSYAQNTFPWPSTGNIGIGTTTPLQLFQVNGNIAALAAASSTNTYFTFQRSSDGYTGARVGNVYEMSGYKGSLVFEVNNGDNAMSLIEAMRINSTGNIGIGTIDPRGYKLAVNGSVIATSMTVKLYSAWPDYVFKKDYQLPSLEEVKAYIDQNQHLPEIPSEQQIAKDGLNLGEMNKLLMKKVEELTLYLIEKDGTEKKQEVKLQHQEELLKSLLSQFQELKEENTQLHKSIDKIAQAQ